MKALLPLVLAAIGSAGFATAQASAAAVTLAGQPAIVHIDEEVIIVQHHHRHGHYVWRHHHRVWVSNY